MKHLHTKISGGKAASCFFIGGEWVAPRGDRTFDLVSPATEEVFARVPEAGVEDVELAVAAARRAFDEGPWPRLPIAERVAMLRRIAEELDKRMDELAAVWSMQMGAVTAVARYGSAGGIEYFRQYADIAERFEWIERHDTEFANVGLLAREPVGVVAAIVPWNAPMLTMSVKVAPALVAGCTVVVKPSPETPLEAFILAEAAEAAGLPEGVLNVLTADREVSEKLVTNPGVDKVTFTGSSAAGKRIASLCGERIARYTLELGGKSAGVVLDDYDVELVAHSIAQSTCVLSNQVCAALTRIVVPRNRHDQLLEAFAAAFSGIAVGDPFDENSQMGPLAMKRQLVRVQDYIAKGREEGGVLATGGGTPRHLERGYFIEPTVFGNVSNASTIAREEIFGPVVSIIPAEDEADAVRIANDSPFGLNSAVFTHDAQRAYEIGRQLLAGTVCHNGFKTDFSIAFGGFKQSGVGREGGREGLLPFLEPKTILLDNDVRL